MLKLMQQQAEQQRLSEQYNREMINSLMLKMTENAQASAASQMDMMRLFSQQNAEFAAMNQASQTQLTQQLMAAQQGSGGGFFGGLKDIFGSVTSAIGLSSLFG